MKYCCFNFIISDYNSNCCRNNVIIGENMNYKFMINCLKKTKEIRIKVFMEEQGFKDEFDDLDDLCQHLVVFENNQPIGTCRFYYDESLKSNVLGRIAVIKEYRGKKVGQYIVKTACSLIQGNVCLHAQLQAKPFYEKLGFKAYGEIDYDEDCPHTWMKNKRDINFKIIFLS